MESCSVAARPRVHAAPPRPRLVGARLAAGSDAAAGRVWRRAVVPPRPPRRRPQPCGAAVRAGRVRREECRPRGRPRHAVAGSRSTAISEQTRGGAAIGMPAAERPAPCQRPGARQGESDCLARCRLVSRGRREQHGVSAGARGRASGRIAASLMGRSLFDAPCQRSVRSRAAVGAGTNSRAVPGRRADPRRLRPRGLAAAAGGLRPGRSYNPGAFLMDGLGGEVRGCRWRRRDGIGPGHAGCREFVSSRACEETGVARELESTAGIGTATGSGRTPCRPTG